MRWVYFNISDDYFIKGGFVDKAHARYGFVAVGFKPLQNNIRSSEKADRVFLYEAVFSDEVHNNGYYSYKYCLFLW